MTTDDRLYDKPWPGHLVKGLNDALVRQIQAKDEQIEALRKAGDAMYYVVEWVEGEQAAAAVERWEAVTGRTDSEVTP